MSVGRALALVTIVAGMFLAGCASSPTAEGAAPANLLSPEEYGAMLDIGDRHVINVHTPDEGSIAGTDLAFPFDELEQRKDELPEDRTTKLAIYCMSGNMSESAAKTLRAMGYDDIVDLRGGMEAWRAGGRELQAAA